MPWRTLTPLSVHIANASVDRRQPERWRAVAETIVIVVALLAFFGTLVVFLIDDGRDMSRGGSNASVLPMPNPGWVTCWGKDISWTEPGLVCHADRLQRSQ